MDRDAILAEIERLIDEVTATKAYFGQSTRRLFEAKIATGETTEGLSEWLEMLRVVVAGVSLYAKNDLQQ